MCSKSFSAVLSRLEALIEYTFCLLSQCYVTSDYSPYCTRHMLSSSPNTDCERDSRVRCLKNIFVAVLCTFTLCFTFIFFLFFLLLDDELIIRNEEAFFATNSNLDTFIKMCGASS